MQSPDQISQFHTQELNTKYLQAIDFTLNHLPNTIKHLKCIAIQNTTSLSQILIRTIILVPR